MRKITSLLILLCMFVGTAWAEVTLPATDKAFTVIAEGHKSGVKPGWAINNDGTAMVSFGNTDVADEAQKNFAFIQYEGKVYLYSVWAKKFVNKDMALTDKLPVDDITVENVDGGKYFFKYDDTHIMNIGGSRQLAPDDWSDKDGGNQYTLTVVEPFDPAAALAILDNSWEITYQFKYNGTLVATQTTKIAKGANYPAVNAELLPWGVVASVPSGAPTKNETIELACSVDVSLLPFIPASNYESIEHWYYLKFHATELNYLYYAGTEDVLDASKTAVDASNIDAYTWAFVGNPFDGFKVVNKLAGESKAIVASASGAIVSEGADNVLKLTASTYGTNGFFMQATTGEKKDRFNKQGGKVVYWTGADAGSTFMVKERDLTGRTELQALVDAVEAAAPNYVVGEGIGYHTQASVDAVAAAVAAAKTALAGTMTEAISAQHQAAINNAVAALVVNMPTPGALYRIKNVMRERFVSVDATGKRVPSEENNANASLIWTVEKNGDVYMIKNLNYGDNGYMKTVGDNLLTNAQEAAGYSLVPFGEGQFKLTNSGSNFVDYGGNKGLGSWSSANKGGDGAWYFIPATAIDITIGEAGYATTYLPFDVTLDEGVKAYAVTSIEGERAKLTEKTDIPANTAAILEGEGTHTLTIATAASDWTGNLLKGTNVPTNIAEKAYVLSMPEGESVGFYAAKFNVSTDATNDGEEGAEDDTFEAFRNNANKAYLPASAVASGARFISFDFGTETAIDELEGENGNVKTVIYDLSGRRVQKAQKGVFIVNGKVVIK